MKNYPPYTESLEFEAELFVKACKEIMRKIHKEMGFKISHEEFIILEVVYMFPGILQGDISKKIFMQRNYVCKLLAKLEDCGYITRKNSIRGKRQVLVNNYITELGLEEYEKVRKWIDNEFTKRSCKERKEYLQLTDIIHKITTDIVKVYKVKF